MTRTVHHTLSCTNSDPAVHASNSHCEGGEAATVKGCSMPARKGLKNLADILTRAFWLKRWQTLLAGMEEPLPLMRQPTEKPTLQK